MPLILKVPNSSFFLVFIVFTFVWSVIIAWEKNVPEIFANSIVYLFSIKYFFILMDGLQSFCEHLPSSPSFLCLYCLAFIFTITLIIEIFWYNFWTWNSIYRSYVRRLAVLTDGVITDEKKITEKCSNAWLWKWNYVLTLWFEV